MSLKEFPIIPAQTPSNFCSLLNICISQHTLEFPWTKALVKIGHEFLYWWDFFETRQTIDTLAFQAYHIATFLKSQQPAKLLNWPGDDFLFWSSAEETATVHFYTSFRYTEQKLKSIPCISHWYHEASPREIDSSSQQKKLWMRWSFWKFKTSSCKSFQHYWTVYRYDFWVFLLRWSYFASAS